MYLNKLEVSLSRNFVGVEYQLLCPCPHQFIEQASVPRLGTRVWRDRRSRDTTSGGTWEVSWFTVTLTTTEREDVVVRVPRHPFRGLISTTRVPGSPATIVVHQGVRVDRRFTACSVRPRVQEWTVTVTCRGRELLTISQTKPPAVPVIVTKSEVVRTTSEVY